ncbi:hypothetical protein J4217_01155 [Candidatus Pacearchaeota archaeon]|nr:hypothetical protein [Candidatus Pacearchaeota archaeon]
MTICYGPTTIEWIITIFVAIIVPIILLFLLHKIWKPKKRIYFIIISIIVFLILGYSIGALFAGVIFKNCAYDINCNPIEIVYYEKNNTCEAIKVISREECKILFNKSIDKTEIEPGIYTISVPSCLID